MENRVSGDNERRTQAVQQRFVLNHAVAGHGHPLAVIMVRGERQIGTGAENVAALSAMLRYQLAVTHFALVDAIIIGAANLRRERQPILAFLDEAMAIDIAAALLRQLRRQRD